MKIRQISADERESILFPLVTYAFLPSPWGAGDQETYARRSRFFETAVCLVAEEDDQALASVSALRMRQNVRGMVHDMAGVATVTSHPSARRRGLVRELIGQLLRRMRDEGSVVSALYPFRASFYHRFGFVGIPRYRTAAFAPEGLSHLTRAELPGEVVRLTMGEGFSAYDGLQRRLLGERHGFAVFDETRAAEFRDDKMWVAVARVDGEVVGAVKYRVDRFGGDLVGSDLLTTGPLGRTLLLQYFGRHVDQVSRVVVRVGTDDVPELWGVDFAVTTEGKVDFPRHGGPMVRVLDMGGLTGTPVGDGDVTVEIRDDELIGGTWRLVGEGGRLTVTKGGSAPAASLTRAGSAPAAALTAAGFSGLLYGVLDPVEVTLRGFGEVQPAAITALATMFPRRMPYICADY